MGGGRGWRLYLRFKINNREPSRAQSREEAFTLDGSSRLYFRHFDTRYSILIGWRNFRVFVLDSDWPLTTFWFWAKPQYVQQGITIWNGGRQCFSVNYGVLQCIKVATGVQWLILGTVRVFRETMKLIPWPRGNKLRHRTLVFFLIRKFATWPWPM